MNEIDNVFVILLFIWGVLEIILFLKVWKMTNSVEKIEKSVSTTNNPNWNEAMIETLLENYEKAYSIYNKSFINDVFKLYSECTSSTRSTYFTEEYEKLEKAYKIRLNTLKGEFQIDFEKYNSEEKIERLILY